MGRMGEHRERRLDASDAPEWAKNAIRRAAEDNTVGYDDIGTLVGHKLKELLSGLIPERYEEASQGWTALDHENLVEIRKWCRRWIPEVYRLIRQRRRQGFATGLRDAWRINEIDI